MGRTAPNSAIAANLPIRLSRVASRHSGRWEFSKRRCRSHPSGFYHTLGCAPCDGTGRMSGERVERRLAAILAVDVAGYSRPMGEDEEGTLAALRAVRRELGDPKITEHRGRIVKTTGDGLLVEFASVVDAVRCAVEVQREMVDRNAAHGGSNFAWASMSATSSSKTATSLATASTSPRAWRRWPSRAGSASARRRTSRCETSSISRLRTWASSRSRTSRGRCGHTALWSVRPLSQSPLP